MARVLDKNYYPLPFPGGSTMISSVASGEDTLETHEFYNAEGKVVFYWKLKKNADGDLIVCRVKVPNSPAAPATPYVNYESLT
jgi:hypothetical protein